MDNATTLAKGAMVLASRNPTPAEAQAVASGGEAALRSTLRTYMQGPAFERFLYEAGETHFFPQSVVAFGVFPGLDSTDFPSLANMAVAGTPEAAYATRFSASVQREPVELMRYIVRNELPWTDMVSGNYTVMNGVINRFVGATLEGAFTNPEDDNEWRRGTWRSPRLGGTREHAGVLSTHAWLMVNQTTPSNRNRKRVRILAKQFLATDLLSLAARPEDSDTTAFLVPWLENPGCKACHDVMDPMAAGFQNWSDGNRYLPYRTTTGVDHALASNYRNTTYPRKADGQPYYQMGDNWYRDAMPPGYGNTLMPGGYTGNKTALQWLGTQVANDPRFALGAVHFWYKVVFGREPLQLPTNTSHPSYAALLAAYNAQSNELNEIAARFRTNRGQGAYNVKDLLVDLLMSRWYRAVRANDLTGSRVIELQELGSTLMLNPSHLQRKLVALLGRGYPGFNEPYLGRGLDYGDFNGRGRRERANSHTTLQTSVMDNLTVSLSCSVVRDDFARTNGTRLLVPTVSFTDTPASTGGATAIVENIRYLHKWLLKEDLAANDPEIQRTYKLFQDVWNDRNASSESSVCIYNNGNDPNYVGRSWAAVVAYLVGDPKFLFE